MKALLLVAHGSRRQASNDEVIALSRLIMAAMKQDYPIIEAGFLELAAPTIIDAIGCCVTRGATEICVVPYFLSAGRHIEEDVPAEIKKAKEAYSDVPITLLPHVGAAARMTDLICELVTGKQARPKE